MYAFYSCEVSLFLLQLQQFVLAVLDITVSEHEVDLELLEADENGEVPMKERFEGGPKTCFSIILHNKLEVDVLK